MVGIFTYLIDSCVAREISLPRLTWKPISQDDFKGSFTNYVDN